LCIILYQDEILTDANAQTLGIELDLSPRSFVC